MNTYALVLLLALLGERAVRALADGLELRRLRDDPESVKTFYAPGEQEKARAYTMAKLRLGLVESTFDLAVLLVFWFTGGFAWLDQEIRALADGPIGTGLLYLGVLGVARALLEVPFTAWSTFVIENRFGFNRTSVATFFADLAKGGLLLAVLGLPVVSLVLWAFESLGAWAWVVGWLATSLFMLFVQVVFPTWILPLFNDFRPLEAGGLRDALERYARSVGYRLDGIFVVDGSRRSSRANAYVTGLGESKRIALFDTLLEKHTESELVAILAHEVGHDKKGHLPVMLGLSVVHTSLLFWLLSVFLDHPAFFAALGVAEPSVHVGLVIFGLLYAPVDLFLSIGLLWLSRRHEYEADQFAVDTVESPEAMATALEKLSADHLVSLAPHPLQVALSYSHPPVLQRLAAVRAFLARRSSAV